MRYCGCHCDPDILFSETDKDIIMMIHCEVLYSKYFEQYSVADSVC